MKNKLLYVNITGLVFWIGLTFAIAAFASTFEPGEWYQTINKPTWTPPGYVFGPVWGFLYLSMAIAAWLVWLKRKTGDIRLPLLLYLIQILVNGLWSWFFFGLYQIGLALLDLSVLLAVLALIIYHFNKISKPAAILFIPYFLWGCFAWTLNYKIWLLN